MPASAVEIRKINDTLTPVNMVCYLRGDPYDWTSKTASIVVKDAAGATIASAATLTAHPTQTFTAGTGSDADFLRCVAHGVRNGDQVVLATTGTLPTGLTAATRYYVVSRQPNEFKVSDSPTGTAIAITASSGSGTHTFYIVGSIQADLAAGTVDSAERLKAWIVSTSSSETQTFPDDDLGLTIDVRS